MPSPNESEQLILNSVYDTTLTDTYVSGQGFLRVSSVNSPTVNATTSPLSADSSSISAKQGDAGLLHVSAFSNDAGLLRVSSIGATGTSNDILIDGRNNTVSATIIAQNFLLSGIATSARDSLFVRAYSLEADQVMVSAKSGDSGLMRVSAILAAGVSSVGAASFGVSAAQLDAGVLRASAIQGDSGLLHVSSQAFDYTTSAFMTAIGNSLTISALGSSIVGAQLSGTWTGTIAFQATVDESNWFPTFGLDQSTMAIVSATTVSRNVVFDVGGLRRFRLSATAAMTGTLSAFLDASLGNDNMLMALKQEDAGNARLSALSQDSGLLRVSAILAAGVSSVGAATFPVSAAQIDAGSLHTSAFVDSGSVSAKSADANNLHASAVQGDAGLFHVSAIGTITVSAHEVKQSDAAALLVSAKQGDAGLLRVSSLIFDAEYSAGPNVIVSATATPVTSSMKGIVASVVSLSAGTLLTSAKSGDGNQFHVSAVQGDSGLLRVSGILQAGVSSSGAANFGVSAAQIDAGALHVSAFVDSGSVSAKQADANNLHASAVQGDSGLLHVSASVFPDTTGGLTMFSNFNVSTSQTIKSTAGAVYGWYAWNSDTKPVYVNLYNTSGAINVGTDTIQVQIMLPASAAANVFTPIGLKGFTNGIGVAAVSGAVSTSNSPPAASAVGINVFYK